MFKYILVVVLVESHVLVIGNLEVKNPFVLIYPFS